MKISNIITKKIKADNAFSLGVASAIGISQRAVQNLADRKSDKLKIYEAVEFYRANGFTDNEIFE